jgi:hypothetical protein
MIIENQPEVEEIQDLPETEEGEEDTTDWKALALKNQGIAKRLKTKLDKSKEEIRPEVKPEKEPEKLIKKEGFDYAEKAYLKTSDVLQDEFPLVQEIMASTGKTLDEVLESKYFRAEQKELREAKASAEAIPTGTRRSGQSAKNEVEYWLAKGQLPPADQPELRQKYVNAKLKAETSGNPFTPNPVIQ